MNIYLISQHVNTGYDTYDSAVVTAETAEEARKMPPDYGSTYSDPEWTWTTDTSKVKVTLIGTAFPGEIKRVICASFHAG